MVLKPGWLNRQFDQVTRNVDSWPEWMKRAAGFEGERPLSSKGGHERENRVREDEAGEQRMLGLQAE